jgi:hypothetical protein
VKHGDVTVAPVLKPINDLLVTKSPYIPISLLEYIPSDPVKKYRFVNLLESSGLTVPFILLTFNPGSNIGKILFIWKVPEGKDIGDYLQESQQAIEEVKKCIPVFHTRAMKSALFSKFGRLTSKVKPAVLRQFYRELTGDQSSSDSTDQSVVDKRIQLILDMEDPEISPDLCIHNSGHATKFEVFWKKCEEFLNEDIGVAVDDRRHGVITHAARAISVRDLVQQVRDRCPEEAPIPSVEWVRLQFWSSSAKSSLHNTGRFKMKLMVQQHQWRHSHIDCHYAAAYYRFVYV